MFIFCYSIHGIYIKWANVFLAFTVLSGVRQGDILTRRLFGVYFINLSKQLNNARSDCFIGHQCNTNVMYVDVICL